MLDESPDMVRNAAGMPVALGVFGKHVAWSDHIDPIGVLTPSLAEFRRRLYEAGIRRHLDSGAWNAIAPDWRVDEWGHQWITFGSSGILLARLWNSIDGRGRSAYPMVAAVHLPTARPPESFEPLFSLLAGLQGRCMETDTADGVKAAVQAASARLPDVIARLAPQHGEGIPVEEREAVIGRMDFQEKSGIRVARVFHHLGVKPHFGIAEASPRGIVRLPVDSGGFLQMVTFWRSLFSGFCEPGTMFSVCQPVGTTWFDLQLGEFTDDLVFRLRAAVGEIPIVPEIPFNIPEESLQIVRNYIASYLRGDSPVSARKGTGLWSRLGIPWVRK